MALGAPPQTPGRLRRKIVAAGDPGGFAARAKLGAPPPVPRWGSAPAPVHERVWGRSPSGVWGGAPAGFGAEPQRGSEGGAPSNDLAAKPPRGLGRSPKRHVPPSPSWLRPCLTRTF